MICDEEEEEEEEEEELPMDCLAAGAESLIRLAALDSADEELALLAPTLGATTARERDEEFAGTRPAVGLTGRAAGCAFFTVPPLPTLEVASGPTADPGTDRGGA